MKPRLKNVTAEDINSSLYYLHLDVSDDANYAERAHLEGDHEGKLSFDIQRKPVTPRIGAEPQPSIPPTRSASQVQRKPLRFSEEPSVLQSSPNDFQSTTAEGDGVINRRPLGPRPPQKQASLSRKPLPSFPGIENASILSSKSPNRNFETSPERQPVKNFSITLIRRDPTSNSQWNIGRISSQPLFNENVASSDLFPGASHGPVFLYIDNPGYTKFHQNTDHHLISKSANDQVRPGASLHSGFSRQINITREPTSDRKSRGSVNWQNRPGSSGSKSDDFSESARAPESSKLGRITGYTFLSPWNGLCSFNTSVGGRSLKCRHILSGNGMQIDAADQASGASAEVSELRFNLPNSALFAQKQSASKTSDIGRFAAAKLSHIRNKMSSDSSKIVLPSLPISKARSSTIASDDDEFEDDDGLDQLGQEKAGGGNRGKRVKLAKLIIEHEGLQMLDLVVASNMGIFWKIWDR